MQYCHSGDLILAVALDSAIKIHFTVLFLRVSSWPPLKTRREMRCSNGLTQHGPSQIFHLHLSLFSCRVRRKAMTLRPGRPVMSARAYGWGHQEFGSCLPGNELRTLSGSLLPAAGCQQSYFTYPESNNYKGAIIFCHYYRITAIS